MHDFHMHSNYSSDASFSLSDIASSALHSGLKGICFTDHVDIDYPDEESKFELDYVRYGNEIDKLKQRYSGTLEIFKGVELGLQRHVADNNNLYLSNKTFDFVIGSIHAVNHKEICTQCFHDDSSEHQGILDYFDELNQCLDNFHDFDVVGHFDGIRRHISKSREEKLAAIYADLITKTLKKIVSLNKGIEVNTSGLRYKLSSFHPSDEILKEYKRLGGEIITLGSDSHHSRDLGYCFKEAIDLLSGIGFKYYTIFKDRKPIFIKL